MTINAIVLDIGGVVLRTEDRSGRNQLEAQYGLPTGSVDDLVFNSQAAAESTVGKTTPEKIWQFVAEKLSLTPEALVDFQHAFWKGDLIDQKLIEYLASLHGKFTTAFLTNAWVGARNTLSNQYGISEGNGVDYLLISSELGIAKPDQKIFYILSDTINTPFHQILFIDDFFENIAAAGMLGIHTIHYKAGMDLIARIQSKVKQ